MINQEWKEALASLDQDWQLTPYSDHCYQGRPGSIWYVAYYHAICLIPSDIRRDDKLNECGLHRVEKSHICDSEENILLYSFPAFYVYLYHRKDNSSFNEVLENLIQNAKDTEDYLQNALIKPIPILILWEMFFNKEENTELWNLLQINYYTLYKDYERYVKNCIKKVIPTLLSPFTFWGSIVWLTDEDIYQYQVSKRRIKQSILLSPYGDCNYSDAKGTLVVSEQLCFSIYLLKYYVQFSLWTITDHSVALLTLDLDDDRLVLATDKRIQCRDIFMCGINDLKKMYDTYLDYVFEDTEKTIRRETALYDDTYVWQSVYEKEKRNYDNSKLKLVLPAELYSQIEEYTLGLLRYIAQTKNIKVEETPTPADQQPTSPYLWQQYSPTATDEQKQDFERYLKHLCSGKKKSLTRDIKTYLEQKEKAGIIIRPSQQNTEYEWVKLFGYPYTGKAYYGG